MKQNSITSHFQQKKPKSPKEFAFDTPCTDLFNNKPEKMVTKQSLDTLIKTSSIPIAKKDGTQLVVSPTNDSFGLPSTANSTKKRVVTKRGANNSRKRKTTKTLVISESNVKNKNKRKIKGKFKTAITDSHYIDISKSSNETSELPEKPTKRRKTNSNNIDIREVNLPK
jgi:hypothetical protein